MTKDSLKLSDSRASERTQPAKKSSTFRKFLGLSKFKVKTSKQHSDHPLLIGQTTQSATVATLAINSSSILPPSAIVQPRKDIFTEDISRPGIRTVIPRFQDRIEKTEQLVYCNILLLQHSSSQATPSKSEKLTPTIGDDQQALDLIKAEREWLVGMDKDPMEQEQLRWLVKRMVEEFVLDPIKDSIKIAEVVALGPVLNREHYRKLLSSIIGGFENARILDVELLQGLIQLVQTNSTGYLLSDDLVKILRILRIRLEGTHQQTTQHSFHLTLAVSRVLDVMADHKVEGLDRVLEHEPLSGVLSGLTGSLDPYLMYQACYAFQALHYVPDDETALQAVLRHSKGVASGLVKISGLMKLDVDAVVEGLEDLQEVLGGAFGIAKSAYEGACSVMESGRSIMESLQDGYGSGSGKKRPWYAAIRAAYALVQAGQLRDFNRLIYEAPCRRDSLFQWGVCQLLGEIASDTIWDSTVRQQAVDFLGELYKNDPEWGQDENAKTWMLSIINQLSAIDDNAVSTKAHTLLKELKEDQNSANSVPYPLRSRLSLPASSSLLTRVLAIPDVEYDLHKLRLQRLEEHRRGVYIPPQAKPSLQAANDTLFPLMEKVQEFLAGHRKVFLVLGDSGAGKSTFNLELENILWRGYKKHGLIPLYINLPTIDDPTHDLIEKQLQYHNFSNEQIQEMKQHRQFVIICDGYDESQLKINLYTTNEFNQTMSWKVKMVISCRSQYLGRDYRSRFQPHALNRYQHVAEDLIQEAVVAVFSRAQIQQYVDEYVRGLPAVDPLQKKPSWTSEEYMDKLVNIPNMLDLVSNPFLLSLSLDTLPAVIGSKKDLSSIRITRVQLYDTFVKRWLEINRARLEESPLSEAERSELDLLVEDNFLYHGIYFQKHLATAIFFEHAGNPVVKYTHLRDKGTWKATFFAPAGQVKLLREASTVMRSGPFFRFLHRSLLEYFYSRTIYEPRDYDSDAEDVDDREPAFVFKTCLSQISIVEEPSILQFLAERVSQDLSFKQQLLDAIEESKADAAATTTLVSATNAISILVRAGVSFNGADLRGVKIPGADLSNGQFDSVQFQGSDLTGVDFSRSWMRQADLSGAQLDGARFGELPYIGMDCSVMACAYSPDGTMLAIGLEKGNINIYSTTTWEKIHCLTDIHQIRAIAFSPDGRLILSSGLGRTVRLRDIASGEDVLVMKGHSNFVRSVAFSPSGKQIASSSQDLRMWDAQTGECLHILVGHSWVVGSVQYSPDGRQLVSGSEDGTIRFWDTMTGEAGVVLSASLGKVNKLAFSFDGQWIASGHVDGGLQLWNATTKESGPILSGHTETVTGIFFSPHGQWVASSSQDCTVRLWDVSTGALLSTLNDHQNFVNDVVISPYGLQMASGGADRRIRLWEMNSNRSSSSSLSTAELQGHNAGGGAILSVAYSSDGGSIMSVCDHTFRQWNATTGAIGSFSFDLPRPRNMEATVFSPDGDQIASCDDKEGSIQLWDRHTGAEGLLLEGHTSRVVEMAYSPCGRWIASASWDNVVRLWELHDPKQNCVIDGMGDDVYESVGDLVYIRAKEPRLAVSASNGIVRFFHPQSGELLLSKKLSESRIQHMASAPGGGQLALSSDFSVFLWDMQSDKPSIELKGHTSYVYTIAYSPCGQWITTGSDDRTVRVWRRESLASSSEEKEVESWSCASVVRGFLGTIQTIAWNHVVPSEFVTGCLDGSVRVWKVSIGDIDHDYGKDSGVSVKLVWGSNLKILCAEDLAFENAIGLASKHRTLLSQRRVIEGTIVAGGGDGWGEERGGGTGGDGWGDTGAASNGDGWGDAEITSNGDGWGDAGITSNGDGWGDAGITSNGDGWGDAGTTSNGDGWGDAGTTRNGDGWGDAGTMSNGDVWGDEGATSNGDGWGDEDAAADGTGEWGDEGAATPEGDNWSDEDEAVDTERYGYGDEEVMVAKEEW